MPALKLRRPLAVLLSACFVSLAIADAGSLQTWIDITPAGQVLRLPPGVYRGPAKIDKPMTLDGQGQAIIDAGGQGSVLSIRADGVTIRGLSLRASGPSHDALDSGIFAEGKQLLIEDNRFEDVLFGITLQRTDDSIVRRNRIRSIAADPADRGDGLRLWYSNRNLIEDNDIADMRDITVSNALENRFVGNRIRDSRRAFNFLFSHASEVDRNQLENNSAGIVALNSENLRIRDNSIMHAMAAAGACVALKETSAAWIIGNRIVHCAYGIMADSPTDPINRIVVADNLIAHNITGIHLYGARGGHMAIANSFLSNLSSVTVIGDGDPLADLWWGNYWDNYEGFDLDGNGQGDQPHEVRTYADRIWIETPAARFFRNSPLLELLDFLERLAPFSAPSLILRDAAPQMQPLHKLSR